MGDNSDRRPPEQRFWKYVDKKLGKTGCWNWTGHVRKDGYGEFNFIKKYIKIRKAHRVAFFLTYNEIPLGGNICHKCDNRKCVNPSHLFSGSQKDNIQDFFMKSRNLITNHPSKLSILDVKNIRVLIKNGVKIKDISKTFNVTDKSIACIKNGNTWSFFKESENE